MFRCKALEDYGTWIRKGEIVDVADQHIIEFTKKKIVEPIEYIITVVDDMRMKITIEKLLREKRILDMKFEAYKERNLIH